MHNVNKIAMQLRKVPFFLQDILQDKRKNQVILNGRQEFSRCTIFTMMLSLVL